MSNRTRFIYQLSAHLADQVDTSRFRFVLFSRRFGDDQLNLLGRVNIGRYEVTGFDEKQLSTFVSSWLRISNPITREADTIANRFIERAQELGITFKVPLLVTLALITYDKNGKRFPITVLQIYASFVESLLFDRQVRVKARKRIRKIFEDAGHDGDNFAEQLYRRRQDICSDVAYRLLDGDDRGIIAIANDWLDRELGEVPYVQQWERRLESILLDTGLIIQQGSHFAFIHQTVAEYLAAQVAGLPGPIEQFEGWICTEVHDGREQYLVLRVLCWSTKNNCTELIGALIASAKRDFFLYHESVENLYSYWLLHRLVAFGLFVDVEIMREYVAFYIEVHRGRQHWCIRNNIKVASRIYSFNQDYVQLLDALVSQYPDLTELLLEDEYDKYTEPDARVVGVLPLWHLGHRQFVENHLLNLMNSGAWGRLCVAEVYAELGESVKAVNVLRAEAMIQDQDFRACAQDTGITSLGELLTALLHTRLDYEKVEKHTFSSRLACLIEKLNAND